MQLEFVSASGETARLWRKEVGHIMLKAIAVLLLGLASVAPAYAQVPAPPPPGAATAPDPIAGQAAFGYLATSGNTESTSANARLGLLWSLVDWSHEFDLSAIAATTSDTTTTEAYSANYESRRAYGQRAYLFTVLDWKRDRFSAYDQQISESVGYGRRLIDRERHQLSAEVGSGARQARLLDGTEQDEGILRLGLDYTLVFSEMTGFTQDFVVESGSSNTSVESLSALRARLWGDVAMVLSFRVKRNSDVPVGTLARDTFTAISVEYAF